MKLHSIPILCLFIALAVFSFSFIQYPDAKKDVVLINLGAGTCKAGLLNRAVQNRSATKKIDVVIMKQETGGGMSTTSSTKYSGLPPGYKQVIGCGGTSVKDSTVITYSIKAAMYSSK